MTVTEEKLVEYQRWVEERGATSGGSWTSKEPMITLRVSAVQMLFEEIRRLWVRERELLEANNREVEGRRAAEHSREVLYQGAATIREVWRELQGLVPEMRAAEGGRVEREAGR